MDVNDHGLELRSRAIGMVTVGMSQKEVASTLNVSERSIRRWYKAHKSVDTLETKDRSELPPKIHSSLKLSSPKSLNKRRQSTRKLATKKTSMGYPITHTTIRRRLTEYLSAKSFCNSQ